MKALYKILILAIVIVACGSTVMYQAVRHDETLVNEGSDASPLGINRTTITPPALRARMDDYDPTGWDEATIVRLESDNIWIISSMAAPDAATSVSEKTLINVGDSTIVFVGESPSGTAANRIITSSDYKLYKNQSCKISYDDTADRWRIIGEENTEGKTGWFHTEHAGGTTTGDYGQWQTFALGGAYASLASTTTLPAAWQGTTSTSSTASAIIYYAEGVTTISAFGSAHNYAEALVSIPTLSDGTETYTAFLQITNSPASATLHANNSVGIRYLHSVNSGKWQGYSKDNAGSESTADLGITVAVNTLYKLRVEIDKSRSEARFYVNDSFVGRVAANIPNAVVCSPRVGFIKSNGTTARLFNVHNFSAGAIYQ